MFPLARLPSCSATDAKTGTESNWPFETCTRTVPVYVPAGAPDGTETLKVTVVVFPERTFVEPPGSLTHDAGSAVEPSDGCPGE
jgi:hypothetical protein